MMAVSVPKLLLDEVARAGESLARGEPILIFDAVDREGETDLVFLSEKATPELLRLQRKDAGGLICTAISEELRARLGLPFASELLAIGEDRYPILSGVRRQRLRYDQ